MADVECFGTAVTHSGSSLSAVGTGSVGKLAEVRDVGGTFPAFVEDDY